LGAINVQRKSPKYQELGIYNWPTYEELSNDLEGICSLSQRAREHMIVESGFYYGNSGRIIKIRYTTGFPGTAE